MSKTSEAAFLGISGVATGAGVASVVAGLAFPAFVPLAAIVGGIVSFGALKAGRVLDAPDETLIPGTQEKDVSADVR